MLSHNAIHFEQIADGLAQHGFSFVDNFLLQPEIDDILNLDEFNDRLLHFKKAGIGNSQSRLINEAIRGDYIHWIDPRNTHASLLIYFEKLKALMTYLNQNLFLSLKEVELHLTSYPVGSFYKRHLDQFKLEDHRKISVILYVNKYWKEVEGGQLRIYNGSEVTDVFPISGRLVCMRSDKIEHEVLPATRERMSVTGWMLDQLIDVK